jgi:hypothetical protein
MSAATRRVASLIAGLALTFTPGVVLACAVLLCAPSGHHAATSPGPARPAAAGHEHHHPVVTEGADPATGHHHDHARAMSGADTTAALAGAPRIQGVPRDCCASVELGAEPAIVSPRVGLVSQIDALVVTSAPAAEGDAPSVVAPDPARQIPPPPHTSPRVLRI